MTQEQLPNATPVNDPFPNIPATLKQYAQWCYCTMQPADRDPKGKRLRSVHGGYFASSSKAETWGPYAQAVATIQTIPGALPIFVLTDKDPFALVDLDHTIDPRAMSFQGRLKEVGRHYYNETSSSGHGHHIILQGVVGAGRRSEEMSVEVYDRGRPVIFTGNGFGEAGLDSNNLIKEILRGMPDPVEVAALPDNRPTKPEDVIKSMTSAKNWPNYKRLYEDGIYDRDPSSQDYSLAEHIAQHCRGDGETAKAVFRMGGHWTPDRIKKHSAIKAITT